MTLLTTAIRKRKAHAGWRNDPRYVYVGRRACGFDGYFGNPLYTIDGYEAWLQARLDTDPRYRENVRSLYGKILVCPCNEPVGRCHAEILAVFANALGLGLI